MNNVLFENREGIGLLTLNSPDTMNALSQDLISEIRQAVDHLPELDVLIITGTGKGFVAGANIREMLPMTTAEALAFSREGHALFSAIESLPFPVIAMVNGYALGGGCELMLACDLRVAAASAKIGQPETGLGIIPGFGGTQRLTAAVGPAKAKELIFTGRIIPAAEALAIGLINQIAESGELESAVFALAHEIQKNSASAVSRAKQAIDASLGAILASGFEREQELFAACFDQEDQKEGMTAFLEKRRPKFGGK